MRQVKIFSSEIPEDLEKMANKWLHDNQKYEINARHIQYSGDCFVLSLFYGQDTVKNQPLEQVKIFEAKNHENLESEMNNWLVVNADFDTMPIFLQHTGVTKRTAAIFYTVDTD